MSQRNSTRQRNNLSRSSATACAVCSSLCVSRFLLRCGPLASRVEMAVRQQFCERLRVMQQVIPG